MKYVIVLGDGMAGEPLKMLGDRTTLEAAETPVMDQISKVSEQGIARMVPEGMAPGSDTANLSVTGYDPRVYYTGRSPLEALSIGVKMEADDVAFRCNIVTLSEEETYEEKTIIDHSSSEISTEDAAVLMNAVRAELTRDGYEFYVGTSYRHLLIWKGGKVVALTPPHDILTQKITTYLPEDEILRDMMKRSYHILSQHPINIERKKKGLNPANSLWFWGAGTRPSLTSFEEKTGKKGVMISAVDLLKGIAVGAGMDCKIVEGATGGLHTNYEGKAQAAIDALTKEGYDFAYIHVEAPDEMGHQGSAERKIQAIQWLDEKVIGLVKKGLEQAGEEFRMLILPDHPTPICVRTHTGKPVPYLLYDSTKAAEGMNTYNEVNAKKSGIVWEEGYRLIDHLLGE